MKYIKLKVTSDDDAKRFYRTIAIKGDPDLYTLGALIGLSVQAWFEHLYMFQNKKYQFIPDMWIDDLDDSSLPMSKYHLSDLGENFTFIYDTGENYLFNCRIMKTKAKFTLYDDSPLAFVVDGKGAGIFENDHLTLWRYLNGDIDPDSSEEINNDAFYQNLPMNMEFETYGDFDKPLDLEMMLYFEDEVEEITDHFKKYNNDDYDQEGREATEEFINKVAGDIFRIPYINDAFKELIKTHDVNAVFDMIIDATLHSIAECGNNLEDFEEIRKKNITHLIHKYH